MEVINARNVNNAYDISLRRIFEIGLSDNSRNGGVLVSPTPVMTVTARPEERVLFDVGRDANPFFHFFECLWLLSGSNNAVWLDRFVKDFSSRYAEKDGTMYGAYGHRWRHAFKRDGDDMDQLEIIVQRLKKDRTDRRVVLTMWDPETDLDVSVSDVPCNTQIYPRIVGTNKQGVGPCMALDLTVTCRSNDIIWGATGANAVHFSFLQEYIARRIGVEVGTLYQLSNNWHAYTDTMTRVGKPKMRNLYQSGEVKPHPIMDDPATWDIDLDWFMNEPDSTVYNNSFFTDVAQPMWVTHRLWSGGSRSAAIEFAKNDIAASDWRTAVVEWMERRV